jgi:hypothetical protein
MTVKILSDELEAEILAGRPLNQIVETLRGFRDAGVSRDEVSQPLESLRARTTDEATEDRILEVMDLVSGFCRADPTVWDD